MFGAGAASIALSQPRDRIYNPQLAAHTSIWIEEAQRRNLPLGDILDEAFSSTGRAGYTRVELGSDFLSPELRPRTLALLSRTKIQPAVVFTSGPLYARELAEPERARVLDLARMMQSWNTRFINFSPAQRPDRRPKTSEELDTQAYQLNRLGQELAQAGMGLTLHHTQSELLDSAREWRYMLAHTETGAVSLCLDVDWVVHAGLNPVALMDTAGARLRNLHLRNPKNGINQELLRDGDIDMAAIARFLRQMSYDGLLTVELLYDRDTQRQYPLAQDLSLSRWYMQEIFGSRPGSPPVDMGPHVRERTG
jgi:sugar phosphate isomerase/epimerase